MNANPVLMQKKYARVIAKYAQKENISFDEALRIFYHSTTYQLMREGVSDLHCMSDGYLAEELSLEQKEKERREHHERSGGYAVGKNV